MRKMVQNICKLKKSDYQCFFRCGVEPFHGKLEMRPLTWIGRVQLWWPAMIVKWSDWQSEWALMILPSILSV